MKVGVKVVVDMPSSMPPGRIRNFTAFEDSMYYRTVSQYHATRLRISRSVRVPMIREVERPVWNPLSTEIEGELGHTW